MFWLLVFRVSNHEPILPQNAEPELRRIRKNSHYFTLYLVPANVNRYSIGRTSLEYTVTRTAIYSFLSPRVRSTKFEPGHGTWYNTSYCNPNEIRY